MSPIVALALLLALTACGRSIPDGYHYSEFVDLLCPAPPAPDVGSFQSAYGDFGEGRTEEQQRQVLDDRYGYETVDRPYGFAVPYAEFPGFYKLTYYRDTPNGPETNACLDVNMG